MRRSRFWISMVVLLGAITLSLGVQIQATGWINSPSAVSVQAPLNPFAVVNGTLLAPGLIIENCTTIRTFAISGTISVGEQFSDIPSMLVSELRISTNVTLYSVAGAVSGGPRPTNFGNQGSIVDRWSISGTPTVTSNPVSVAPGYFDICSWVSLTILDQSSAAGAYQNESALLANLTGGSVATMSGGPPVPLYAGLAAVLICGATVGTVSVRRKSTY